MHPLNSRSHRQELDEYTVVPRHSAVEPGGILGSACSQSVDGEGAAPEALAVQIGAENVVSVESRTIVVGPIISGELTPTREATVRAELGGAILHVAVEEAQAVSRGALLGRIEARTLDDTRLSAVSAMRSAENQLAVARRETERTEQLVEAGALAARELDVARNTIASAEAQLADARSRLASAERTIGDTVIRAPINGIVASRMVNTGDVVVPGTELFTHHRSLVHAARSVRPCGRPVAVCAWAQRWSSPCVDMTARSTGRIERIAPQADSTTRQVPIYVAIPNPAVGWWQACLPKDESSPVRRRACRAPERRQHQCAGHRGCCASATERPSASQ